MRPLGYCILTVLASVSLCTAQLALTIVRNTHPTNSVTLRWVQPHQAIPPVTYTMYSSTVFLPATDNGWMVVSDSLLDLSYRDSLFSSPTKYFRVSAVDSQGDSTNSNVVGFVKFTAVGGVGTVSTPFGIPFVCWNIVAGVPQYGVTSSDPSDIIGDQANCATLATADRILRQDNGEFAIPNINSGCAWTQHLQTNHNMTTPRAFWYQNKTGVNREIMVCGEANVLQSTTSITVVGNEQRNVATAYSWRDPRVRSRDNLQFFAQGFMPFGHINASDRILEQIGGRFFYREDSRRQFAGSLYSVEPGQAYWIIRFRAASRNYTYNPISNNP